LLPHQIQKCRKSGTHGLWLTWIDFMFSVLSGQLPTKHSCLIATTDLLCFIVGCKFWGRFRVFTPFFLLHILVGSLKNERDMDSSVYALETGWTNLWAIWVFWKDFSDWYEVQDFSNSLRKHISLFKGDKLVPEEPPSELLMFLQLMLLQDWLLQFRKSFNQSTAVETMSWQGLLQVQSQDATSGFQCHGKDCYKYNLKMQQLGFNVKVCRLLNSEHSSLKFCNSRCDELSLMLMKRA